MSSKLNSKSATEESFTFTVGKLGEYHLNMMQQRITTLLRCWNGCMSSSVINRLVNSLPLQILIGERAHLIEFPSLLLPPGVTSGSIVNISVNRNVAEEKRQQKEFWDLQDAILETFGKISPEPPVLEVGRIVTLPFSVDTF